MKKIFPGSILLGLMLLSQSGLAAAPQSGPKCPEGIGSSDGDVPRIVVSANSKFKLIACGNLDEALGGTARLSEFNVYSVDDRSKFKKLLSVSALESYWVAPSGNSLSLKELFEVSGKWVPVFEKSASCDSKKCSISRDKCIYQKRGSPADAAAIAEIHEYESGKFKGKVPDESWVSHIGDLALAGNPEAQRLFLSSHAALSLDGASAEVFETIADMLRRMKKANCLPHMQPS